MGYYCCILVHICCISGENGDMIILYFCVMMVRSVHGVKRIISHYDIPCDMRWILIGLLFVIHLYV
jgi:hypothetical protein